MVKLLPLLRDRLQFNYRQWITSKFGLELGLSSNLFSMFIGIAA